MPREIGLSTKAANVRAVVGILKKEDKVLIAERPLGKPYSGYWEFPGGKIEADESGEKALKRELKEELGIDVLEAQPCFVHTHTYPDKTVNLEVWLITQFLGQPESKENQKLCWASFADILSHKLLEGNWAIIEKIKQICFEN